MRVYLSGSTDISKDASNIASVLKAVGAVGPAGALVAAVSGPAWGPVVAAVSLYASLPKIDFGQIFGLKPASEPVTEEEIKKWYTDYLGRAADAGGLSYWYGRAQQVGREIALQDFLGQVYIERVRGWYALYLARLGEPAGVDYWVTRCQIVGYDNAFAEFTAASKNEIEAVALARKKTLTAGGITAAAVAALVFL